MSYFYGKVIGASQPKTTRAHKSTGIKAVAMSFSGDIGVTMTHNDLTGNIEYSVVLCNHDTGVVIRELASGELEG